MPNNNVPYTLRNQEILIFINGCSITFAQFIRDILDLAEGKWEPSNVSSDSHLSEQAKYCDDHADEATNHEPQYADNMLSAPIELAIPLYSLETCCQLQNGQILQLSGKAQKTGSDEQEHVAVTMQKKEETVLFSMYTHSDGTLENRLTEVWKCTLMKTEAFEEDHDNLEKSLINTPNILTSSIKTEPTSQAFLDPQSSCLTNSEALSTNSQQPYTTSHIFQCPDCVKCYQSLEELQKHCIGHNPSGLPIDKSETDAKFFMDSEYQDKNLESVNQGQGDSEAGNHGNSSLLSQIKEEPLDTSYSKEDSWMCDNNYNDNDQNNQATTSYSNIPEVDHENSNMSDSDTPDNNTEDVDDDDKNHDIVHSKVAKEFLTNKKTKLVVYENIDDGLHRGKTKKQSNRCCVCGDKALAGGQMSFGSVTCGSCKMDNFLENPHGMYGCDRNMTSKGFPKRRRLDVRPLCKKKSQFSRHCKHITDADPPGTTVTEGTEHYRAFTYNDDTPGISTETGHANPTLNDGITTDFIATRDDAIQENLLVENNDWIAQESTSGDTAVTFCTNASIESNATFESDVKDIMQDNFDQVDDTEHVSSQSTESDMPSTQDNLYRCGFDDCEKTFKHRYSQVRHERMHSGTGPQCHLCQLLFPDMNSLNRHNERVHENTMWPCVICNKVYISVHALNTHKKIHTQKNFKHLCPLCSRSFQYKTMFDSHMAKHNGLKPHVCPKCDKAFDHVSNLAQHKLTCGLTTKPFSCTFCSATFKADRYRRTHEFSKHMHPEQYQCTTCGERFSYKASLANHIKLKKHH